MKGGERELKIIRKIWIYNYIKGKDSMRDNKIESEGENGRLWEGKEREREITGDNKIEKDT